MQGINVGETNGSVIHLLNMAPDYTGAILLLWIWYTYSKKEETVKMLKMVNRVEADQYGYQGHLP